MFYSVISEAAIHFLLRQNDCKEEGLNNATNNASAAVRDSSRTRSRTAGLQRRNYAACLKLAL